ncbi:MAG: hypothetical protein HUK20_01820 [Fibrobacter sp.]|nr:hypothetical protein [Fibrobacter sp.]
MFFRIFKSLCFFSVVALTACDVGKTDQVVVSVGDSKLTESDIRQMAPSWDTWDDHARLTFLEHWIDEETIYQEALDQDIVEDTLLQYKIEQVVRKTVVDYFLQSFADTMLVGDAERMDYYTAHPDLFVRGQTLISGAILSFKDWPNAEQYYRGHKKLVYDSLPAAHYLIKNIQVFDTVAISPDSCVIPSITEVPIGKLTPMKLCGGTLKMAVVLDRKDSAEVRPYAEVAVDVADRAWVEHQKKVMERLKKEWKNARPIFSKTKVFSGEE